MIFIRYQKKAMERRCQFPFYLWEAVNTVLNRYPLLFFWRQQIVSQNILIVLRLKYHEKNYTSVNCGIFACELRSL